MRKIIRQILDDLKHAGPRPSGSTKSKAAKTKAGRTKAGGNPEAQLPDDLNNQILSKDPVERVRQLDFQAQQDEERETLT
jgi:hypothetical protein